MIAQNRPGYILVMALMIIALVVLITGVMNDTGSSFVPYMNAMQQREKARVLALSGIALAQSQLGKPVTAESSTKKGEEEKKPTKPTAEQESIALLKTILPLLNRWQSVELHMEREGIDATIQFCIMSEDGKININEWFDFKAKKFKNEKKGDQSAKALLATLLAPAEKRMKTTELVPAVEQYLAKRGYPLNDITELLTLKPFAVFKHAIFYTPAIKKSGPSKEDGMANTPPYALTDIFTTHTNHMTVEPWLFSDSLRGLLTIARITDSQPAVTGERVAELLKQFKQTAKWQTDWDQRIKNWYGVPFTQLPKQTVLNFSTTFSPRIFSVLVTATVGDVTQRLYAILERVKKSQDTRTVYDIIVRTFYWI